MHFNELQIVGITCLYFPLVIGTSFMYTAGNTGSATAISSKPPLQPWATLDRMTSTAPALKLYTNRHGMGSDHSSNAHKENATCDRARSDHHTCINARRLLWTTVRPALENKNTRIPEFPILSTHKSRAAWTEFPSIARARYIKNVNSTIS